MIMKLLIAVVFILGLVNTTHELDCFTCSNSNYDGESVGTCFVATADTTSSITCNAIGTEYCLTKFTLNDGVAVSVQRNCADPSTDHVTNSDSMPTTEKCVTTLTSGSNPRDLTECYFHCSGSNNCNTKTAVGLLSCPSGCSGTNMAGTCDYIVGRCVCNVGFEGVDCSTRTQSTTPTVRQCVQCNSETDATCATATTGSACPGAQQYCSTATTTIFDPAGNSKKTVTTRGCVASMFVVDQCFFSDIYTDPPINSASIGYKEITCASTCSSDNCNTNTANGVIEANEAIAMYCVQCIDTSDSLGGACATAYVRTICPVETTHCKATVEYLISEKTDVSSPATASPVYRLLRIVRECATAAVTNECTDATFAGVNGVRKVTCTETCDTDGCNTGWPTRPKCITCESTWTRYGDEGYDDCLENPPDASMCSRPYEAYCTTHETGIPTSSRRESVKGFRRRIRRECSRTDIGSSCSTQTIRNIEIDTCNYTCIKDGCNQGTSGGFVPFQTVMAVMMSTIFGWLIQMQS